MSQSWLSKLGLVVILAVAGQAQVTAEVPWHRHTIDASSRGADGVRLADVDGDGRPDVVTGWEEGGIVRVYRQPGPGTVTDPWPAVTVGEVKSPEDAVLVDLDRDGAVDVVSCCEGKTRTAFVHWAPQDRKRYWDPAAWSTEAIPATTNQQAWMFCLPDLGPTQIPEMIIGSKGNRAAVSRLVTSEDRSAVDTWMLHRLCEAGWIMSLRSVDMDGDGDRDVLFSDRKGPARGVGWLEQPRDADDPWPRHVLGATTEEVMFLDIGDLTGDGHEEVAVATRSAGILVFRRSQSAEAWDETMIPMPPGCGTGKAVQIADVDGDGRTDLVVSCENSRDKHGVFWLSPLAKETKGIEGEWAFHPLSGDREGIKFDRLEMLDLDADGDLDVMTCEERDNLGVIWYENPLR